jgi:hypothetical protein
MNVLIHIIASILLVFVINFFDKKTDIKKIFILVLTSNFIDLDHLLANPIYDPNRCSINFHPLHSWYMFPIYFFGSFLKNYRYFFFGIILHLVLDWIDCLVYF